MTVTRDGLETAENVKTRSSPATIAFAVVWACVSSELDTLFAVPPKAVVLILTVNVAVPDADRVVTLVIVLATVAATITR